MDWLRTISRAASRYDNSMLGWLSCFLGRKNKRALKYFAIHIKDGANRKCVALVEEADSRKALLAACKNLSQEHIDEFNAGKVFLCIECKVGEPLPTPQASGSTNPSGPAEFPDSIE